MNYLFIHCNINCLSFNYTIISQSEIQLPYQTQYLRQKERAQNGNSLEKTQTSTPTNMDHEENHFGNHKLMLNQISTETYFQETVPLCFRPWDTNQTRFFLAQCQQRET